MKPSISSDCVPCSRWRTCGNRGRVADWDFGDSHTCGDVFRRLRSI